MKIILRDQEETYLENKIIIIHFVLKDLNQFD